jgi:hypothetical protein
LTYVPNFDEVFEFIPVYKVLPNDAPGVKKDVPNMPGVLDVLLEPDGFPFFPKKYSLAFMSLSTIII